MPVAVAAHPVAEAQPRQPLRVGEERWVIAGPLPGGLEPTRRPGQDVGKDMLQEVQDDPPLVG